MPQRRRRKRVSLSSTGTAPAADAPNRVWAVFQFDATTDGRPVKILSVVDEHTRECLGGLVERSITGEDLIDELDRLTATRDYPAVLRCDNGPELGCTAMADRTGERLGLCFIPPSETGATATSSRSTAGSRPMPEHHHLLVPGPRSGRDQRRERRLQPPPAAQCSRLPAASGLRCWPHPPMIDSHPRWTSSRGPFMDFATARHPEPQLPDTARYVQNERVKPTDLHDVLCLGTCRIQCLRP